MMLKDPYNEAKTINVLQGKGALQELLEGSSQGVYIKYVKYYICEIIIYIYNILFFLIFILIFKTLSGQNLILAHDKKRHLKIEFQIKSAT